LRPKASPIAFIVLLLLVVDVAIFSAAQFPHQSYVLADQICFAAYNLCDQPFLLGVAAGTISSVYCLHLVIRRNYVACRRKLVTLAIEFCRRWVA
jgi:hypothetical protein